MNNEQHQNTQTSAAPAIPSPFQKKTCWHALTGVSILVMLGIAAFVIFEVVELLGFLEPVLLPILIAAVVAYLLEPIVSWLVRLKFSRPWAVVTVMFAALAVLVGFGATILPPLIRQTDELIDNRMELWDKTSELIDSTIEIPFISRTIDSVYSTSLRELNASHYTEAEVHDLRNARTAREKLGAYMTINSSFYQDK
ncbi:AI-2E family transporter, partial [Akkermansia muciniphila]